MSKGVKQWSQLKRWKTVVGLDKGKQLASDSIPEAVMPEQARTLPADLKDTLDRAS